MSAPTNHWKLGLFVVVGVLLGIAAVVYLGARSLQKEGVTYTSYVDEAVTGLEIGSPVRFRGVTIGSVSAIRIADDRRHVELTYELAVATLSGLGLATGSGSATRISTPPDLRVQVDSQGITGVKYLLIDFFAIDSHPPPSLPFRVPDNYIPSTPSTMKDLQDSVVRAIDQFPAVAEKLTVVLGRVDRLLSDINESGLTQNAAALVTRTDRTLALISAELRNVRAGELSNDARATMANLNSTLTRVQGVLARVDGDEGVLASVQRASDSIGDAAGDAQGFGSDLGETLEHLGDAADAFVELVDALERDSDMLIKGRSKAGSP
jgi:phospholipid/cholesterol/gamma-HCH transport system substrate-binding protein